ncbi:MAG: ECF-type sigma factor [Pseudomonadota bacterium]
MRSSDPGQDVDAALGDELRDAVYARLRTLAADARRGFFDMDTLGTTALVHEAWLRLRPEQHAAVGSGDDAARQNFFRLSASVMRRVLVDTLRRKTAAKRLQDPGEGPAQPAFDEELLALDAALKRLGEQSSRLVAVVECRYFAGYTQDETAELLGLTERTVRQDWHKARAMLKGFMDGSPALAGD